MDVSNSFTKVSLATSRSLGSIQRHPTPRVTLAWLKDLRRKYPRHHLVLGSVVPTVTARAHKVFRRRLFSVNGSSPLPIVLDYPHKAQIGADRIANAVAARHHFGAPVVVIDFGTAVTFDIVNARGAYCGGVIAPGLNAMTDYLHEKTALLPRLTVQEPRRAIGRSTVEAMQAGAIIGYRGLVRGLLQAIQKELKTRQKLKVIATGGQAELVARHLPEIQKVDQKLTLEGLRLIGLQQQEI
jgi:type III pantothenate kinase